MGKIEALSDFLKITMTFIRIAEDIKIVIIILRFFVGLSIFEIFPF